MTNAKTRPYRTFVLRCWQAGCNADDIAGEWRYVVQEAPGGEYRKASTSLGTLVAQLRVELDRKPAKVGREIEFLGQRGDRV
jgi:hypothetical protein